MLLPETADQFLVPLGKKFRLKDHDARAQKVAGSQGPASPLRAAALPTSGRQEEVSRPHRRQHPEPDNTAVRLQVPSEVRLHDRQVRERDPAARGNRWR